MIFNHCGQLDDYLAGDLPADDRSRFEQHLADCHECTASVEHWRHFAKLLRAAREREPAPEALAGRVTATLSSRRRQRQAIVIGATAAIAAALLVVLFRNDPSPTTGVHQEIATVAAAEAPPVVVQFPNSVLAVAEPTDSPNVSFFWVYPVAQPSPALEGAVP